MQSLMAEVSHLQKKGMESTTQEASMLEQHDSESVIATAGGNLQTPVTTDRVVLIQSTRPKQE